MISACPRCTLLGFALSTLLHLGIAASLLSLNKPEEIDLDSERAVAVNLTMFADPEGGSHQAKDDNRTTEPKPEQEPEPATEPEPAPTPESDPEPIPKTNPLPKREPAPEPEVKPASAPKPHPKPPPKPKPNPKPKPKFKPKSKPVSKPSLKSKPEARPAPQRTAINGSGGNKSSSPSGSTPSARVGDTKNRARTKALEQKYLAGLRRAIANKRRYPASARRRGDTGVVTVSFVIAQNGRISGARVDKSSGASALDKAAVETLRRLGRYKPIPKAIGRSRWSMRVPIRFALE